MIKQLCRGDIFYANLSPVIGCEQGGIRPVLILQNDKGNRFSNTVVIAPISSRLTKNPLPTHVQISNKYLNKISIVLLEQVRTIDKQRLAQWVSHLDECSMLNINNALKISLGLD